MSEQFGDEFLQDFYVEADEHLTVLRRVLLVLESSVDAQQPRDDKLYAELFRSLHTLKGLSGMVGFNEVEQLTHALEDWFKRELPKDASPSSEVVARAFEGVGLVATALSARQGGQQAPDLTEFIGQINACRSGSQIEAPSAAGGVAGRHTDAAIAAGQTIVEYNFTPTPLLAAAGVTVERVRAELQSIGEILQASPRVQTGGVTFRFLVAFPAGMTPPELTIDGVTSAPYASTRAAAQPAVVESSSAMVRVHLSRLDDLMRHIGELVISRSRLDDALRSVNLDNASDAWAAVQETNTAMERELRALREAVMRVRLVPVGEVFERLKFAARETARESGKIVQIELFGERTEIDKLVVDRMLEPLMHIVRNAVSHGLENPEERVRLGKPPQGMLTLAASAIGDRVRIEVRDDGHGVDRAQVVARARAGGVIATDESVDAQDLLSIISAEGFSTRESADMSSGRGVGMAVVSRNVKALGGELTMTTQPGAGTKFLIELPLTLMIVEALLTRVGSHLMAIPMPALREVLQVDPSVVTVFENNEVMRYRDGVISLLRLPVLFGEASTSGKFLYVLVVGTDNHLVGLVTDKIVGAREIVVRPVDDPLVAAPGIAGATELSDGRLVLILDANALARVGREARGRKLNPSVRQKTAVETV
jgi:two-component system, chemotaxis family, sensor kinase CheA